MKLLAMPKRLTKSAVIASIGSRLPQLFDVRSIHLSRLSGYPAALHSIGRLQRIIDPTSLGTLIASIQKIQSIARTTADVIDNLDGTKMDKYQLNRTDIVAYVLNITAQTSGNTLTEADVDIIANLVTSFEANSSNWILQGPTKDDNIHAKFHEIYKTILLSDNPASLPAYGTHNDTVMTFGKLPHIESLIKRSKKTRSKKGALLDTKDDLIPELQNAGVLYRLAMCKFVDHVYQLLLDKNIWYTFVAPRTKADLVTNQARSQSLRLLFTYCQSLLTYYQFFTLEMFMKSYELVQEWVTHFPPLEATVIHELENVIRAHDLLDARGDVRELMDSFTASAKQELDAITFPSEFLGSFGLTDAVEAASELATEFTISGDLSNIAELSDPKFIPLLSGTAVTVFEATADITKMLITDRIVSNQIREAMVNLIPSFTRGTRKQDITAVKALGIKASLPFLIPLASTYHVVAGVDKGVDQGSIAFDSASPQFSYDYHQWLRDNMKFKMKTDLAIAGNYPDFQQLNVRDKDRARELREILNVSWRTLVPSSWAGAEYSYLPDVYTHSYDQMRRLIEDITGSNYEVVIRELTLPHVQKLFATAISSFGLLYWDRNDTTIMLRHDLPSAKGATVTGADLIEGHGNPYGTTYGSLAAIQSPLTPDTDVLKIGTGLYIRFLDKVPVVTHTLQQDSSFYNQRPVQYFASNSQTVPVTRWIMGDALENFTLIPVHSVADVPAIRITPRNAYLTQGLYINFELFYKPAVSEAAREVFPVRIEELPWDADRHQFFLKHMTFGKYSNTADQSTDLEGKTVVDAVKKIEEIMVKDEQEVREIDAQAGASAKKVLQSAETGTAESHAKLQVPGGTKEEGAVIVM